MWTFRQNEVCLIKDESCGVVPALFCPLSMVYSLYSALDSTIHHWLALVVLRYSPVCNGCQDRR